MEKSCKPSVYGTFLYAMAEKEVKGVNDNQILAVKLHVEFYSILAYNIYKAKLYKERKLILCQIYYLYQI